MPIPGARARPAGFFLRVRHLVAAGRLPTLDTPEGFSNYLVRTLLTGTEPAFPAGVHGIEHALSDVLRDALRGDPAGPRTAVRRWFSLLAPRGLVCARGLSSLSVDTAALLVRQVRGAVPIMPWEASTDTSFSLNIAYAANRFARPAKYGPRARRGLCLLLVARLPVACVSGFGGDSESGPLMEAEIKVRSDCLRHVKRVFLFSPEPLAGFVPVPDVVRRRFALSYRLKARTSAELGEGRYWAARGFPLLLHADADLSGADELGPVRLDVEPPLRGWHWWETPVRN